MVPVGSSATPSVCRPAPPRAVTSSLARSAASSGVRLAAGLAATLAAAEGCRRDISPECAARTRRGAELPSPPRAAFVHASSPPWPCHAPGDLPIFAANRTVQMRMYYVCQWLANNVRNKLHRARARALCIWPVAQTYPVLKAIQLQLRR